MPERDENKHMEVTNIVPLETVNTNLADAPSLHALENHYKNNALTYAKNIQDFTLQIEHFKSQIAQAMQEKEEEEVQLIFVKNELHHYEKLLQRLNESFSIEVKSMEELQCEYKEAVEKKAYEVICSKKKELLQNILDDIEEQENTLLQKELERLNILSSLEPKRTKLKSLENHLHTLELNKQHYESTLLEELTKTSQVKDTQEIVETVIMEDKI